MQRNKIKYILGMLFAVILSSCINDLNVVPIDPNLDTADKLFDTEDSYKMALAKVYASYVLTGQQGPAGDADIQGIDEGFSSYLRQYWGLQELSTDEAVVSWDDATIKDFHYHTWTSTDVFIMALYSRIFYSISLSNEFIRMADLKIPEVDGTFKENLLFFREEARFIRAFSYWHAIDLFGNVPFVTEANKPGAFLPEQIKRADLFKFLETELLDLESKLLAPGQNEYGRIDQAAAWMLLAKLYLNAEVYAGVDRNTDALTYIKKVLNSTYSLDPNYSRIFSADNNTSPEIIFPLCFDGQNTQSYGGTTFLLNAGNGDVMPDNGVDGNWGGFRTGKELVGLFGAVESDFTTEDPLYSSIPDKRGKFFFNPATWSWNIVNIGTFTHGIGVVKYSNLKSDGTEADNKHASYASTDYVVFRLGDAYLMYAEAVLRGGSGGDKINAVKYINALRERAFGNSDHNITEAELTLDFVLDERARELYWEAHRRTDLIRFGKFTGDDLVWEWKGKVQQGTSTEWFRALYPIPENDMMANPNLDQNEGY